MSPAPVGQHAAFDAVVSRLSMPRPGIVVLAGSVGSGRSKMLSHLAVVATELDYRVLGTEDDPIVIDTTSTIANVLSRLQTAVDGEIVNAHGDDVSSSSNGLERAVRWLTSRISEHNQIIELVEQLAPVVVMIDGYTPGSAFGTWFSSALTTYVQKSEERVAIIVAGNPERVDALCRVADLVITLGPLDAEEVRNHLREGAAQLVPPLTTEELDRYVEAATRSPGLVSALFDVFQATASSTSEPS